MTTRTARGTAALSMRTGATGRPPAEPRIDETPSRPNQGRCNGDPGGWGGPPAALEAEDRRGWLSNIRGVQTFAGRRNAALI
jgi:hypothetical protein